MQAHKEKNESDTAPSFDSSGRLEFEIIHPFHPERGRRLLILHRRIDRGVLWLWYADRAGKPRQVKQGFTDHAEPDLFQREAGGRCAFNLQDLMRVVGIVARLKKQLGTG